MVHDNVSSINVKYIPGDHYWVVNEYDLAKFMNDNNDSSEVSKYGVCGYTNPNTKIGFSCYDTCDTNNSYRE